MEGCTFDTFVTKDLDRSVREAKGIAMACVEDGASWCWAAAPGVGKTHLAVAMVQALTARGTAALFVSTVDLLDEIRAGTRRAGRPGSRERPGGGHARPRRRGGPAHRQAVDVGAALRPPDGRYRDRRQTVITTNAKP